MTTPGIPGIPGIPGRGNRLVTRVAEQQRSDALEELKQAYVLNAAVSRPSPQPQRVPPKSVPLDDANEHQLEQCLTFIDRDGELIEAMCCDYGFRSGAMRMYSDEDGRIPANFIALGVENFKKEYKQLRRSFRENDYAVYSESMHLGDNPLTRVLGWVGGGVVRVLSSLDAKLEKQGLLSEIQSEPLPTSVTDSQGLSVFLWQG